MLKNKVMELLWDCKLFKIYICRIKTFYKKMNIFQKNELTYS